MSLAFVSPFVCSHTNRTVWFGHNHEVGTCSQTALRRRQRRAAVSAKLDPSVQTPLSPECPAKQLPFCVPAAAAEIKDGAAQDMLRRLEYTVVATGLAQPGIGTSHCISLASSSAATPILFLHGFDSNMLEYRYMLPMLDERPDVDAHFVDLLGWGLTEKPNCEGFAYGPVAKREHLRAYHDEVMASRPMVVVGASIGGAAAIDFALAYPERVQSLVLLDPQAFTDKPASPLMQMFPVFASWGAEVLRSDWLRTRAVEVSYESDRFKCEDTIRIGGLHCKSEGWKEAAVNFIQGEGYCLSARVKDVDCPALVLWGESDRVLPKGDAQKFVDTIPNCQLEIVKGSGHSPHIEKPSFVTGRIIDFVARLSASG